MPHRYASVKACFGHRGAYARFKALLAEGFCIVSVDYRLARKDTPVRMRDCVIDSKDAVRFLVKNRETLHIDSERVFVFGDSAGGHIAQMLLLSPPGSLAGDADLARERRKRKVEQVSHRRELSHRPARCAKRWDTRE